MSNARVGRLCWRFVVALRKGAREARREGDFDLAADMLKTARVQLQIARADDPAAEMCRLERARLAEEEAG